MSRAARIRAGLRPSTRSGAGRDAEETPTRRVLLLAHVDAAVAVRRWLRRLRADDVTVLRLGDQELLGSGAESDGGGTPVDSLDEVEDHLVRTGPVDLVVVAAPATALAGIGTDHLSLYLRTFLHLRPRGRYVVQRDVDTRVTPSARGPVLGVPKDADWLGGEEWHRLLLTPTDAADGTAPSRTEAEVIHWTNALRVDRDRLVASKRGRHFVKLREDEVAELLPLREPNTTVTTLVTLPGGQLDTRVDERHHGPHRAGAWPERLPYPDMHVRHYEGELVSAGGMRLRTGDTLLPESFRWPLSERLDNPWIRSCGSRVAQFPVRRPQATLEGPHFHLDCVFTGHFGHLMTEVLCRLWGWDRAKAEMPDLKALVHVNPQGGKDGTLERRLLTAYGIAPDDIVTAPGPVRLREAVGASPMWHNHAPHYVHPDIEETWARMTDGLLDGEDPAGHERIFVSRSGAYDHRRGCRNREDVERLFHENGYEIVYPETLPLQEQVALFAGARVVAGFGGSAMVNLMHARRTQAVVVLSHNAYVARNEHLFTSVRGGALHYFHSDSDQPGRDRVRNRPAARSSWEFDFAGLGDDLRRVLDTL